MQDFLKFILHNSIFIFDAEQVYFKRAGANFENKEVTANPKLQPLKQNPTP